MKSIQEFVEMLQDADFLAELGEKAKELQAEGISVEEAVAKFAEEKGFSVTAEEVKAAFDQTDKLSAEDLDQVAGGSTFTAGSYYFNKKVGEELFGC